MHPLFSLGGLLAGEMVGIVNVMQKWLKVLDVAYYV